MQSLLAIVSAVDALEGAAALPPVDQVRPASCPGCGHPAYGGERLGIVGHGVYERAVLGVSTARGGQLRVLVRRFLCRGCRGTISVLPDVLHPRRWYGAWVILEVLKLLLVTRLASRAIAERFEVLLEEPRWRAPRRWARALLDRLWPWWARELGTRSPARDASAALRRLTRLLAQVGVTRERCEGRVAVKAAAALGRGTVHTAGQSWRVGRRPRGASSPRARS